MKDRILGDRELAPIRLDAATAYPSMWDRCLSGTLIGDLTSFGTTRLYEFFVLTNSIGNLDLVSRDIVSIADPTEV